MMSSFVFAMPTTIRLMGFSVPLSGIPRGEHRETPYLNCQPPTDTLAALELKDTVPRLLEQCPGEPLCDACLAFACSVSLTDMRAATTSLAHDGDFLRAAATCGSCRRQATTTVKREEIADVKCVHCSRPLLNEEPFSVDEEVFHMTCWRLLVSDDRIRVARALSRRTRTMIEQTRARLRQTAGGPGGGLIEE
jgi:hypothetical protein